MKTTILSAIATFVALLAAPALANGGGFFHEFNLGVQDGITYLGQVIDISGNPVDGAEVLVLAGDQHIELMTDERGRYRLTGVSKELDPTQVKISVRKAGYQQVRAVNMSRSAKPGLPVEINFVVAPKP